VRGARVGRGWVCEGAAGGRGAAPFVFQ
jgi:hypothetical protein